MWNNSEKNRDEPNKQGGRSAQSKKDKKERESEAEKARNGQKVDQINQNPNSKIQRAPLRSLESNSTKNHQWYSSSEGPRTSSKKGDDGGEFRNERITEDGEAGNPNQNKRQKATEEPSKEGYRELPLLENHSQRNLPEYEKDRNPSGEEEGASYLEMFKREKELELQSAAKKTEKKLPVVVSQPWYPLNKRRKPTFQPQKKPIGSPVPNPVDSRQWEDNPWDSRPSTSNNYSQKYEESRNRTLTNDEKREMFIEQRAAKRGETSHQNQMTPTKNNAPKWTKKSNQQSSFQRFVKPETNKRPPIIIGPRMYIPYGHQTKKRKWTEEEAVEIARKRNQSKSQNDSESQQLRPQAKGTKMRESCNLPLGSAESSDPSRSYDKDSMEFYDEEYMEFGEEDYSFDGDGNAAGYYEDVHYEEHVESFPGAGEGTSEIRDPEPCQNLAKYYDEYYPKEGSSEILHTESDFLNSTDHNPENYSEEGSSNFNFPELPRHENHSMRYQPEYQDEDFFSSDPFGFHQEEDAGHENYDEFDQPANQYDPELDLLGIGEYGEEDSCSQVQMGNTNEPDLLNDLENIEHREAIDDNFLIDELWKDDEFKES